jgi:hypothetical protein
MKLFVKKIIFSMLKAVFVLCFCATALGSEKKTISTDSATKILFVGNSLTYTNNLPSIVVSLAKRKGIDVETEMLAYPNYALEDHWNIGHLQDLIKSGGFDFVVLQQGPSSQNEGRTMLLDYGARIKALCDTTKTRLAFFMVWPAFANLHTFDGVIKNYSDAAIATNSLLCPVGAIWKKHFDDTKDYSYYGPDLFHPSQKGSEIAAKVIVDALFK